MINCNSIDGVLALLSDENPVFSYGKRELKPRVNHCAILAEIDQTLIGTMLRFETQGDHLCLAVNGRRVIGVENSNDPNLAELLDVFLASEDHEQHSELSSAIGRFSKRARETDQLSVETQSLSEKYADVTGHVSVTMLDIARRPGRDQPFTKKGDMILHEFSPFAEAIVWFDSESLEASNGDQELVSELESQFRRVPFESASEQMEFKIVEDGCVRGMSLANVVVDAS